MGGEVAGGRSRQERGVVGGRRWGLDLRTRADRSRYLRRSR